LVRRLPAWFVVFVRLFGTSFGLSSKLYLQYCFLLTTALLAAISAQLVVVVVVVVLTQAPFSVVVVVVVCNKETGIQTTLVVVVLTYRPSSRTSRQCSQFDVHLVWLEIFSTSLLLYPLLSSPNFFSKNRLGVLLFWVLMGPVRFINH